MACRLDLARHFCKPVVEWRWLHCLIGVLNETETKPNKIKGLLWLDNDNESVSPAGIHLDLNGIGFNAIDGSGTNLGQHERDFRLVAEWRQLVFVGWKEQSWMWVLIYRCWRGL